MTNTRYESRLAVAGSLVRPYRYVLGVTKPSAANTGIPPYWQTRLTDVSTATVVTTSNTVFVGMNFLNTVEVRAANVRFLFCKFQGSNSTPSDGSALLVCTHAACFNCIVEWCEFEPQYPHWNWDSAISGHDYTARFCNLRKCTDLFNVFNSNATQPYQSGVIIEQNYLHDVAFWTATTNGVVHPSDDATHNDCIQIQGGLGTIIRGNFIDGRYARQYGHWFVTGDPTTEPYTMVAQQSLSAGAPGFGGPFQALPDRGTGTEATGRYNMGAPGSLSCILLSDNVGPIYNLVVTDNWLQGGEFAVNGGGNANPGGGVSLGTFYRNKFSRDQGGQGSGGNTTQTLNFQGGTWAGFVDAPTVGADANVYEDNLAGITVRT